METVNLIIDYIARTNLFNFVIFLTIIILIMRRLDVSSKIEKAKREVSETINESYSAKESSEHKLCSAEESLQTLDEKVQSIIDESADSANQVGEKILSDGKTAVMAIQENVGKVIENNSVLEKNDIMKRAIDASVEIAKDYILGELSSNAELHNKLIDESIDSIEGVNV